MFESWLCWKPCKERAARGSTVSLKWTNKLLVKHPLTYGYRYIFFTLLQNYKSYYLNIILLNSFTWSCNNHAKFIQLFTNFWNIKSSNFLFKFSPYTCRNPTNWKIYKSTFPKIKHWEAYLLAVYICVSYWFHKNKNSKYLSIYIVQNEITWYRYTSIGDTD